MENDDQKSSVKIMKSKADEIIDTYPQLTFISNCQFDFPLNKFRILAWNLVGTIIKRDEFNYTSLDVEFTNKNFHRNLAINDDFGVQMAALGYAGMVVASKGEQQDLDNYEEEEEDDDMEIDGGKAEKQNNKNSNLYFRPFSEFKNLKDWHF